MRCPSCNSVNARDAARCAACNAALPRRPARKRAAEEPESPASVESNRPALRAYKLSLIGLIPPIGLVLGPIALVQGVLAARKGRIDPAFTAQGQALAAIVFGAADALTNWAGVTLMGLGLWTYFTH